MARNKVCVLRNPAEIEALSKLHELKHLVLTRVITDAEADIEFKPFVADLPRCEEHIHRTKREANRLERQGTLSFLRGFEDHYAQEQRPFFAATGRRFDPGLLCSTGTFVGRLEMYSHG